MSSHATDVLNRIVTVLAGIDGTGSYTHDFSGDAAVRLGIPTQDPARKCLFVTAVAVDGIPAETASRWRWDMTFDVVCFLGPSVSTPGARITGALDALSDIMTALTADRTLGSQRVLDIMPAGQPVIDENTPGRSGDLIVPFTCYYLTSAGA